MAVSDRFDSDDYKGGTGGIDVAFKFMMNDYYIKDLSKKIKNAKHVLTQNGEHIVSNEIYIAEELQKARHIAPGEYFKLARGLNIQPIYRWPTLRIWEILENVQYTGTYVADKTFQDESGGKYHTCSLFAFMESV